MNKQFSFLTEEEQEAMSTLTVEQVQIICEKFGVRFVFEDGKIVNFEM